MMTPGMFFMVSGFILNLLASISLPYLTTLDITHTHFNQKVILSDTQTNQVTELRFGVWAPCFYNQDDENICFASGHGYNISISNEQKTAKVNIGSSWTQGLAVHPVAAGVTFVALLLSPYRILTVTALAAFLTLIALSNDIALFVYLRHQVNKLPEVQGKTTPGPGLWLTLASFMSILLGGLVP